MSEARRLKLIENKRPLSREQREAVLNTAERIGFDNSMKLLASPGRSEVFDLDAEAACLSACMLGGHKIIDDVSHVIGPNDFYSEANSKIFTAITELRNGHNAVDLVVVTAWLRERGQLQDIGGPSYIVQISDATPSVSNAREHARIVRDLASRRKIGALAHVVAAESYDASGAGHEWRADVARRFKLACESDEIDGYDPSINGALRMADHAASQAIRSHLSSPIFSIDELDQCFGRDLSNKVLLLKGLSGEGKSAFMGNMAVDVADGFSVEQFDEHDPIHRIQFTKMVRHGQCAPNEQITQISIPRGVVIFSLEMPRFELASRMVCSQALINSKHFKNNTMSEKEWSRYNGAAEKISRLPLMIDDRAPLTFERLKARTKTYQDQFARIGVRLKQVFVDYIQLMQYQRSAGGRESSREEELSLISGRGKSELANDPNASYCLTWLTNIDAKTFEPIYCKKTFNDADIVIRVSSEKDRAKLKADEPSMPRRASIIVEKHRGGDTPKIHTWFHRAFTRWHDSEFLTAENG